MKDKITLKKFFESKEKLAIHCNTEEKANKLLKEFDKLGKTWRVGDSYLQYNNFNDYYMDKTCYANDGTFCEIEVYKDNNYKIYSFEDIIFEEDKPKNLISEIAKMLGVEIGEEFKIKGWSSYPYKFDGVLLTRTSGNEWEHATVDDYEYILTGKYIIIEKLPKKPQLTKAERVILENLPKKYKWIARDEDDELIVFNGKPFKSDFSMFWICPGGSSLSLEAFGYLFQFIKWEDDNAYKIEDLLKENINE